MSSNEMPAPWPSGHNFMPEPCCEPHPSINRRPQLEWTPEVAAAWRKRVAQAGGVVVPQGITVSDERRMISPGQLMAYGTKTKLFGMEHLAPGSLDPSSLILKDDDKTYILDEDYLVDPLWGGIAIKDGGRLSPRTEVSISYRLSLRRIDSLVTDVHGNEVIRQGKQNLITPDIPRLEIGDSLIANIFIDYHGVIDILPVIEPSASCITSTTAPSKLPKVSQKLRSGAPISMVCWGDSVTEGGDIANVDRFGELLSRRLHASHPGSLVEIVAVGGSNSSQWVCHDIPESDKHRRFNETRFQRIVDMKADVVVIEFVNDQWLDLPEATQQYTYIVNRLREVGSEVILMTPHRNWEPWLSGYRDIDRRTLVRVFRDIPHIWPHGVGCADMAGRWEHLWQEGIPFPAWLANGFNHPDRRGHRLFYEEICRALGLSCF